MSQSKKSTVERLREIPKETGTRVRSAIEKEAADFFVRNGEDSVCERYAYQAAAQRVLSRR